MLQEMLHPASSYQEAAALLPRPPLSAKTEPCAGRWRHCGLASPRPISRPRVPGAGAKQGNLERWTEQLQLLLGLCIHCLSCSADVLPSSLVHLLQEALRDLPLSQCPFLYPNPSLTMQGVLFQNWCCVCSSSWSQHLTQG